MNNCTKHNSNNTSDLADSATMAFPPAPVVENGQIRLGAQSPLLAAQSVADAGKMDRGAQSPLFLPTEIADSGLVRLGAQSPTF